MEFGSIDKGKKFWFIVHILAFLAIISFSFGGSAEAAGSGRTIELILDASGSMTGKLKSGQTKIAAAKKAVASLVEALPDDVVLAFRAYGHQSHRSKKDCLDTKLLVDFAPLGQIRSQVVDIANGLTAQGYTPITYVLKLAAEDFKGDATGGRTIILVSDGKETCEGDPCATALALRKAQAELVIHTIGLDVDEAARGQLECAARAGGGSYFPAESVQELVQALTAAAEKEPEPAPEPEKPVAEPETEVIVIPQVANGWLAVEGADLSGHYVTNSETGERVAVLSHVQSSVELPPGIYSVTVGMGVWKSVEVKPNEKTVLKPGILSINHASYRGHEIIEEETEVEHGCLSQTQGSMALMPGRYLVTFGKAVWPVEVKAGVKTVLNPGIVAVPGAPINGYDIYNAAGEVVGSVSATGSSMSLPPGDYTIEINEKKYPFTLKEGQRKEIRLGG